uniref:Uncharacterized protein n=1 Tax=Chelydra serpentina TaxID=8475 RepID=A0A8C3SVD4_CHESE
KRAGDGLPGRRRRLGPAAGQQLRRGALVPLQGVQRGPARRPPLLQEPGPGLPVPAGQLPGAPLAGPRPGGQRAAQRQRPAAVAGGRRARAGPAGLRPQLLLGRHLHPLPLRQRPAGGQLPGLPAAGRARQRALPPVPAAALPGRRAGRGPRRVRGVPRGAGQHAGHRHRHDGRGGLHLRHARRHLPAGGLRHREPHAAGLRPRRPQAGHVGRGPLQSRGLERPLQPGPWNRLLELGPGAPSPAWGLP